jgi:hypothetical protein
MTATRFGMALCLVLFTCVFIFIAGCMSPVSSDNYTPQRVGDTVTFSVHGVSPLASGQERIQAFEVTLGGEKHLVQYNGELSVVSEQPVHCVVAQRTKDGYTELIFDGYV